MRHSDFKMSKRTNKKLVSQIEMVQLLMYVTSLEDKNQGHPTRI